MANITYTKQGNSLYTSIRKISKDEERVITVIHYKSLNSFEVMADNTIGSFSGDLPEQSTMQEFEELYLKAMIELGLIDCFTKLGFKMSPVVEQMTIAQWNERISKQAKP